MRTLLRLGGTARRAGWTVTTVALVASCVAPGALTAPPDFTSPGPSSPTPTATLIASPTAAGNCGTRSWSVEYAPYTIGGLAANGDILVAGVATRFEPAVFNTTDGKPPRGLFVRYGTVPDAQEYEHLAWPRSRFDPQLLEELLDEAGETVRLEGDRVHIAHLYAERRVTPLNLFVRERDEWTARHAVLDFGQALRDLAATNTFPGDMLLKNFGVTRTGRVIFYDYDELCHATDCVFRDLPEPDEDEETAGEAWFYVGENDVFPEEFLRFLGLQDRLREVFVAAHGDVLTAGFWRGMQERHRAGEVVDIFPYRDNQRLQHGRPADEGDGPR